MNSVSISSTLPPIDLQKIFVVVPAFNEGPVIGAVLDGLLAFGYTVVLVDDGSAPPLQEFARGKKIYLLRHAVNLGQGAALQTGLCFALRNGADYVISFDGDGQHRPEDIARLLEPLLRGEADVVMGSRFIEPQQMPMPRRLLLKLARYINYLFTGLLLTDAHNGLRALNQKAMEAIVLRENRMAHATEILMQIKKQRLRYSEVAVQVQYTSYSRGKGQGLRDSFRIFFDLILNKLFG